MNWQNKLGSLPLAVFTRLALRVVFWDCTRARVWPQLFEIVLSRKMRSEERNVNENVKECGSHQPGG